MYNCDFYKAWIQFDLLLLKFGSIVISIYVYVSTFLPLLFAQITPLKLSYKRTEMKIGSFRWSEGSQEPHVFFWIVAASVSGCDPRHFHLQLFRDRWWMNWVHHSGPCSPFLVSPVLPISSIHMCFVWAQEILL